MDKQHLHEMLEQLHTELEQTQTVDDAEREQLQTLMRDVRELLDRADDNQPVHYQSLGGRLSEAVRQLEVSHPNLTLTIGRVLDTLHGVLP
jgi:hypothetical protein